MPARTARRPGCRVARPSARRPKADDPSPDRNAMGLAHLEDRSIHVAVHPLSIGSMHPCCSPPRLGPRRTCSPHCRQKNLLAGKRFGVFCALCAEMSCERKSLTRGQKPSSEGLRGIGSRPLDWPRPSGRRNPARGGRGIRTHDDVAAIAVFKTAALGHYASPPGMRPLCRTRTPVAVRGLRVPSTHPLWVTRRLSPSRDHDCARRRRWSRRHGQERGT